MKNRVAKLVKIGKIELFEEDIPLLKKDEILVQIKSVGICGSDIHYFKHGGLGSFKSDLPMYLGHEPSGIIVDSNNSKKFKNGDRVAIEPGLPCVTSYWSLRGKHNLCEKGTFMGANTQGALSDFVILNELQLVKIPDNMSYELASIMEPIGVCLHTYNLLNPKLTDTATIFGSGPIGLCMLQIFKKMGMQKIFMIDKLQYRVDFAKKFGATDSFSIDDNYQEKIKNLTDGFGTTIVIDTGGTNESINGCINTVSVSGKVGLIGIPTSDYVEFNPHKMRTKELTLQNIRRSNQTLSDCINLFSNSNKIEDMITHRFDLQNVQKAFEVVSSYDENVIKCIINN